ncbi:MAG TPA: hypothetical protein PKW95_16650 [bacterium]|nr:hypothetical protein [bacterium]
MKEAIANGLAFFKNDFFPNLPFYLLQIFLVVLIVLLFAGINIAVRMITDPICIRVLRMKENKRGPGMVGLVIALVITTLLLALAYTSFPQLRPTVVGWLGEKVVRLIETRDQLPDLDVPAQTEDVKVPVPEAPAPPPEPTPEPAPEPAGETTHGSAP